MTNLTKKQESLLNELLADFKGDTEAVMGQDGLMMALRKRLVEAMLEGEMTSHLGYEAHDPAGNGSGNSRNGRSSKKVRSKGRWSSPATATAVSSLRSSGKDSAGSTALMTESQPCMHGARVPEVFRPS